MTMTPDEIATTAREIATDGSLERARRGAQRVANGAEKPAYIVRTPSGAYLTVLFPRANVEIVETVQPSA